MPQSPTSHGKSIDIRVEHEQIAQVYAALPFGMGIGLFNATLLTLVLWSQHPPAILLAWLGIQIALTAFRSWHVYRHRKQHSQQQHTSHWRQKLLLGILASGTVWGGGAYFLFPLESTPHQIFLIFVMTGMSAGSIMSLSAILSAAVAFTLPAIGMLGLRLVTLDSQLGPLMSLMTFLFLAASIFLARRTNRSILASIALRLEHEATSESLRQRSEENHSLLESSSDGIFGINLQGKTTFVNPSAARMLGYEVAELTGAHIHKLIHHSHADGSTYPEEQCLMLAAIRQAETQFVDSEVFWRRDGSAFCVEYTSTPIFQQDKISGAVINFRDISQRRATEEALRLSATAFEAHEAIAITDLHGNFLRVNRAFSQITGYGADEVIGQNPRLLQSGRHNKTFYRHMWETLQQSGHWEGEIWNRRKDGTLYLEWLTITAVCDSNNVTTHYLAHFQDITERKQAEERIYYQAFYDPLTELPNRRLLLDRLEKELARSRRHGHIGALLFLDLDRFKTINDSLGHATGDELLRQVASRLRLRLRAEDSAARLGGDEFVILLNELSNDIEHAATMASCVAEEIRNALSAPYDIDNQRLHTSPSIGISLFPLESESGAEVLKQADIAMYHAKQEGRNTSRFYQPSMTMKANRRLTLENELRKALDEGQLLLHYQPQHHSSGALLGCEALVRWQHPQRGLIYPDEFLPIAEAAGLMNELGEQVLHIACRQIAAWRQHQPTPWFEESAHRVAINISPSQLMLPDFVERVSAILKQHEVPPHCLELEITEEMLLSHVEESIKKMQALRDLGVRFAIDDFGTGYSSLVYLARLPLDKLKIDRAFVSDITRNESDAAIATSIIDMGHNLKLSVLAEGVENDEQRLQLSRYGCHAFQGYHFNRPLSADDYLHYAQQQFTPPPPTRHAS